MAAPMDSIAFCKIVNEPSFVSVKPGFNESSIIVSSKGKSCDVYALADQKLVKSWSLRHGIKISSPVLWDSQKEKFFCVSNNQDVHTWNKDTPDFDKSKKRHSSTQIHELMLTGENEPVILYCNGVVDFVTNIKTDHSDGPLKPLEQILWSQVASLDSRLVVLFVANCEAGYKLYRVCYEHDSWQSVCSDIPKPTEESSLISVDSYTTDTFVTATFLWLNGKLTQTTVQGDTVRHTSLSHTIRGCEGDSVAMVVLDEIHVAFAGITRGSESGICIYDTKFGLQKSWQPFVEKPQCKQKMVRVGDRLFVPCGTTLYSYQYEVQPSTLSSLLGQSNLVEQEGGAQVPGHYHWNPYKKSKLEVESPDQLVEVYYSVINKASKYPEFSSKFLTLLGHLKQGRNQHWIMSGHMTSLVRRILGERKFWAKHELEQLISNGFIPVGVLGELISRLAERSEVELVFMALGHLGNIPEKCLCQALSFFLQCDLSGLTNGEDESPDDEGDVEHDEDMEEGEGESKQDDMDTEAHTVNGEDQTNGDEGDDDKHAHGADKGGQKKGNRNRKVMEKARARLVNKVLSMSYSDVFLLECLRKISFKDALMLLKYLCYLLETMPVTQEKNPEYFNLTASQIVDWLCLVLDAHITQFVLSPDGHVTIVKLKYLLSRQVDFFNDLLSIETLLDQMKAKRSLPHEKKIGHYCIEVLHIF